MFGFVFSFLPRSCHCNLSGCLMWMQTESGPNMTCSKRKPKQILHSFLSSQISICPFWRRTLCVTALDPIRSASKHQWTQPGRQTGRENLPALWMESRFILSALWVAKLHRKPQRWSRCTHVHVKKRPSRTERALARRFPRWMTRRKETERLTNTRLSTDKTLQMWACMCCVWTQVHVPPTQPLWNDLNCVTRHADLLYKHSYWFSCGGG